MAWAKKKRLQRDYKKRKIKMDKEKDVMPGDKVLQLFISVTYKCP